MNTLSIFSLPSQMVSQPIIPTSQSVDAMHGMMQSIALSHQQVAESSQAKDAAFLRRIEQLNEFIQQLEGQEALLDRLIIAETAEIQTKTMTYDQEKSALESAIANIVSVHSAQRHCISTIDEEISTLNNNLQQLADERAHCPTQEEIRDLLTQLKKISLRRRF